MKTINPGAEGPRGQGCEGARATALFTIHHSLFTALFTIHWCCDDKS